MFNNIDTLIFDMDGTLIDSMNIWHDIDRIFFENHNIPYPDDLEKQIDSLSFDATAEYFLNNFPLNYTKDEIQKIWRDMSFEFYRDIIPFKKGALEFIKKMHEKGYKMGIATSNSRDLVEALDNRLHISDYIKVIVTNDEVPNGKPAPDIYLKVAEVLNSKPETCLVFEDVPGGIKAGKNAGMKVCAVQDSGSLNMEEEKRALADYFITDYSEINIQ